MLGKPPDRAAACTGLAVSMSGGSFLWVCLYQEHYCFWSVLGPLIFGNSHICTAALSESRNRTPVPVKQEIAEASSIGHVTWLRSASYFLLICQLSRNDTFMTSLGLPGLSLQRYSAHTLETMYLILVFLDL